MTERSPHSEHYFGGPYGWQDIESDSRMQFATLEDLTSFLNWKSGTLEGQLEASRLEVASCTQACNVAVTQAQRAEDSLRKIAHRAGGFHANESAKDASLQAITRLAKDAYPARSLDDIDPKELSDGMEATVEPGDAMAEADLDAFDPAKEPTEAELLARRVVAYDRALEAVDPATKPRED